jgi:hypothetical protein
MSRAFTRVLILSALTGFAIAPAVASAAECTTAPPTATVTTVHMSKQANSGEELTLTAEVSPVKKTAPTKDGQSDHKGKKDDKGSRGPSHHKKHRPAKKHKGTSQGEGKKPGAGGKKGKGHKHALETGQVIFTVDGKAMAPVTIKRDRAVEKIQLPQGAHTVTAAYSGDIHYAPSSATPQTFTVK